MKHIGFVFLLQLSSDHWRVKISAVSGDGSCWRIFYVNPFSINVFFVHCRLLSGPVSCTYPKTLCEIMCFSSASLFFDMTGTIYMMKQINKYILLMNQELQTTTGELYDVSGYQFDGAGKYFRPMIVMLVAKACNLHQDNTCGRLDLNC